MNQFLYRIYYTDRSPTVESPFPGRKSSAEIESALGAFPGDLGYFLSDPDLHVDQDESREQSGSIFLTVTTSYTEKEADEGIKKCLNSLGLSGEKIRTPTLD